VEWDFEGIRYFDNGPPTVQYLFVLDALNFCFLPDKDLSYDHLAFGLKAALQNDKSLFSCWFVVLVFFQSLCSLCFDGTLYSFLIYIVSLSLIHRKKNKITGPQLRELLRWLRPLPLEDEEWKLSHWKAHV
jgi:hypothetical protein